MNFVKFFRTYRNIGRNLNVQVTMHWSRVVVPAPPYPLPKSMATMVVWKVFPSFFSLFNFPILVPERNRSVRRFPSPARAIGPSHLSNSPELVRSSHFQSRSQTVETGHKFQFYLKNKNPHKNE